MTARTAAPKRDPRLDPRVGDVVQVIPAVGRRPAPLQVLAVDDVFVTWSRGKVRNKTDRRIWSRTNAISGGFRGMQLVSEARL